MKKLGLNRITSIVCGAIACIGIVFIFLTPLNTVVLGETNAVAVQKVYFSEGGTLLPVISFILLLAGGLCTVAFGLNQNKLVGYIGMGILLASSILLFCTESLYLTAQAIESGIQSGEISKAVKATKEFYTLGIGPILGATCGLIGGLSTPVVLFVFED